ncbi:O-antigen ligase family protein [Microcoleus sp. herbarium8]|uniref:O-antigen ligase family protein n=1 Tax=Microcoleus sp. herbarium8 TaxID=3055436 RepID=UPI002FD55580
MAIAVIVLMLMYQAVARNQKFGIKVEKFFAGIFLFAISGATGAGVMPFTKLHPAVMAGRETTAPTVIGQIAIYGAFLFILSPRLRSILKDYLKALLTTISSDPCLALLLLMISFSALWSETTDVSLKHGLVILETTVIAIYIGKQYSWQELYPWWRTVNLCVLLWSFVKTNADGAGCWNGILGHKNQFSFFMAQTSILWFVFAFYSPKNRRLAIVFGLLASLAVQKGCSGASRILVIILLGLWFYLSVIKKLPVQWAVVSVIIFLIISICLGIVVINNLEAIVVDGLKKDMTLTGRTEFWPQIVAKINERPLLGYGVAGFWQSWRGLENPAHSIIIVKSQFVPPHSHNGFLDLACDLGWGGLILFLLSFLNNIVKGVVYLNRAQLPEAGLPLFILTYTLMTNLTETGLFGVTSVWFWYIVMSVRLSLDVSEKT